MICATCGYDHEGGAVKDCVAALQRDLAETRAQRDGARLVIKAIRDIVKAEPHEDVAEVVARVRGELDRLRPKQRV